MNIAQLMATYNLQIDTDMVPDHLKCVQCKSVLREACQLPCSCRLCRVCIDDLRASGAEFCAGVSEDCGESLLSHFATDYSTNKAISRLIVKCPRSGCLHECALANMEDHVLVCTRESVKCPFHELGCTQDKLAAEEMIGHFQKENQSHSEILIGMVANINNEMESHKREIEMLMREIERLKENGEHNKIDIDLLVENGDHIDMEIDDLSMCDGDNEEEILISDMNTCRTHKWVEDLILNAQDRKIKIEMLIIIEMHNKSEIDLLKRELDLKNGQLKTLISQLGLVKNENKTMQNKVKLVKEEKDDLANQVRILLKQIERKFDEKLESDALDHDDTDPEITAITEIIRNIDNKFHAENKSVTDDNRSIRDDFDSIKSQIQSIQTLMRMGQIDASCEWTIDCDVGKTRWASGDKTSKYFIGSLYPYKYRLTSANYGESGNSLWVWLRMYPGREDTLLVWPWQGTVAITVADKAKREACWSIARQCEIRRPPNNDSSCSDYFIFPYCSLVAAGLDLAHGVIVSCVIISLSGVVR